MSTRAAAISGFVVGLLVLFVAWLFDVSVAHVTLLAPVVVVCAAAVVGLGVFWFRAAAESIREARRPRLVVGLIVGIVVVGVVLTVLGVKLPRE
jgi:Na+/proline symporter